jgi:hypothetical protein
MKRVSGFFLALWAPDSTSWVDKLVGLLYRRDAECLAAETG